MLITKNTLWTKTARWIFRLFYRNPRQPNWADDEARCRKIEALLQRIGDGALKKKYELDCAGVPIIDARRCLHLCAKDFSDARELGFEKLYGLRLFRMGL